MDQKILLITAAVIVVFLPQILNLCNTALSRVRLLLSGFNNKSDDAKPAAAADPAGWVNDLFALQQILLANDRKEAADLVGQAIVKLVNTSVSKTGGSRR